MTPPAFLPPPSRRHDVPGGLTGLPVIGIGPNELLAGLRRTADAFDACPLWLLDRGTLDPSRLTRF